MSTTKVFLILRICAEISGNYEEHLSVAIEKVCSTYAVAKEQRDKLIREWVGKNKQLVYGDDPARELKIRITDDTAYVDKLNDFEVKVCDMPYVYTIFRIEEHQVEGEA